MKKLLMITLLMIMNNALADVTVVNNTNYVYAMGTYETTHVTGKGGEDYIEIIEDTSIPSIPPHSLKTFSSLNLKKNLYLGSKSEENTLSSNPSIKIEDGKTYTINMNYQEDKETIKASNN